MENQKEVTKKFASMIMASLTWWNFKDYVIREKRYQFKDDINKFVEAIGKMSKARHRVLKKDEAFFRARIGPNSVPKTKEDILQPYTCKEMQIPPFDKRRSGRANARGIGVLYLTSDEETAIAEVRPWKRTLVTVVKFNLLEDITIVNLTEKNKGTVPSHLWPAFKEDLDLQLLYESLWEQIDQEFSEPISPDDADISYIHTQILTETFSKAGANGVVYKSSMSHTDGYNLVLFDEKLIKQDQASAHLEVITGINYTHKPFKNSMETWQEGLKGILNSQG